MVNDPRSQAMYVSDNYIKGRAKDSAIGPATHATVADARRANIRTSTRSIAKAPRADCTQLRDTVAIYDRSEQLHDSGRGVNTTWERLKWVQGEVVA